MSNVIIRSSDILRTQGGEKPLGLTPPVLHATVRVAFGDFAAYASHVAAPVRAGALRAAASSPECALWMALLQAAPPAPRAPLDHTSAPQVRACACMIEQACTLSPYSLNLYRSLVSVAKASFSFSLNLSRTRLV